MNKGLEALERLRNTLLAEGYWQDILQDVSVIEKELKALESVKELFDFDFAIRFPTNQPMLRIMNKRTNEYWEIPIPKEKHDLLKEVL